MADWWGNAGTAQNGKDWWGNSLSATPMPGLVIGAPSTPSPQTPPGPPPLARNTYNAKNLPLGDPEIAAQNYGVTNDNVDEWWGKIWNNRTNKAGGSRQIYNKVADWASPKKIRARGGDPNDTQWQLVNEAIRTGKVDPRLKPEVLRRGAGVGLSETARHQQHKKSFLDTWLGKALTLGGQAALSFVPGVGPYLSAGFGGITGAMNGGGPLGFATGALGGYGVGSGTQWLRNGLSTGFTALNDVNAFMPADVAARAGSTASVNPSFALGPGGRLVKRGASVAARTLRNRERRQPPR